MPQPARDVPPVDYATPVLPASVNAVPDVADQGRVEPSFAAPQSFSGHGAATRASAELDRILSEMDLGRPPQR
jgi:hypothetical protein